jgi:hypothetical protein
MPDAECSLNLFKFSQTNVTHENRICKWSKMSFTLVSIFALATQWAGHKKFTCVLIFCTVFLLKNFSFCEEFSEILLWMYIVLHLKYPLWLSGFNETWILSTDFWKILKYILLRKSFQWEPSCFMWTYGQTNKQSVFTVLQMCLKIILQVIQFNAGVVAVMMKIKRTLLYRCKSFEIQHRCLLSHRQFNYTLFFMFCFVHEYKVEYLWLKTK